MAINRRGGLLHRALGRRGVRIGAVALALVVLAGCGPILVNAQTGVATSSATFQVVPTTMTVNGQPVGAIDAQFQWCAQAQYTDLPPTTGPPNPLGTSWTLQPALFVVDAHGNGFWFPYDAFQPNDPGVTETLASDRGTGGVDHVDIPVAGMTAPLTIKAWCTSNIVASNFPTATWTFSATCTTSDRTCDLTKAGTFHYGT